MNGPSHHPEALLRERAWLQALARQLARPDEGAEELAADTLSAATLQESPRTAGVRSWLAAILRKQLAGRRRADLRRRAREQAVAPSEALPATFDTVARFELQRTVGNAVLALPEPYRTTVLLRFWDALPPAAIAAQMAVPVETVRTRLKRGLAQLRERLDAAHGGDRQAWLAPLGVLLQPAAAPATTLSWLAGITFMVTWSKFAVGGLVTAVLVWWLLLPPWAASPDPVPPTPAPAANVAAAVTAPVAPPGAASSASEATTTPERLAAPTPDDVTRLLVRGTVVDDATGAPLAAVPVRIITWPPRDPNPSTTTAADGTFTLRESRAQGELVWQVLVQAPDRATVRHPVARDANAPAPHEIDLGTIRLVPGTRFSGQVVDTEGRPVPAAELLLPLEAVNYNIHRGAQGMLGRTASLGRSDAHGRFLLTEPIAPDSSHRNLLFAITDHDVGWGTFEASQQRRHVDDLVVRVRPHAALRVLVETPDGQPCAAAHVRAIPRFGPIGIAVSGWRLVAPGPESLQRRLAGHTDAQGLLTLPDLFVGERGMHNAGGTEADYELWIEAPGYPQQPLHKVTLAPNTERQATVRLVAPRDLQVTVEVRDDLGAAIAGAAVTVTGTGQHQATTDAAGRATVVVRGTAKLTVAATAAGHQEADRELPVDATASLPPVQLVLVRTQPLDGTVVDQHGRPTPGMNLFVDRKLVATTDAEGRFHIAAFPCGEQPLQVAIGADQDPIGWTGLQNPTRVDAARGPVTIRMERRPGAVDVQIAIVDAVSGEALEPIEANLRIFAYGGFYFAKRVETSHGFVRAQGAPAGRWQLAVRTAAGHQGMLEFELTEGQPPAALRLELPPPGTITGRLQFLEVDPPATLTIDVRHATQRAQSGVRHPGRWQIEAGSQSLQNDRANGAGWSGTGQLRMEPARNATFLLEMADPGDDLVFTVQGAGIRGEARVRVEPGQTRELVLEVRRQTR